MPTTTSPLPQSPEEGRLQTVGPFELTGLLGRGGMREVWAERHRSSGQVLAVKRVLSGGGPAFARASAREVRAVARLDHPGIVRVYDRGEDEDYAPWLAMGRADAGLDQRPPQGWAASRRYP